MPIKRTLILGFLILTLAACGKAAPTPIPTATPSPTVVTATPEATRTPTLVPSTATPTLEPTATPLPVFGPDHFPASINPLTGLPVANPALLERRPLAVKISNDPRAMRPQWGLNEADIVYEYYAELGRTRFIGIFYGQDSEQVGPIRSARLFDEHIVRMYKAALAFVSADSRVLNYLFSAEYADRLVSEYPAGCPPMCRVDPQGWNHVLTNTADLSKYLSTQGVDNSRQNLDGMRFDPAPPAGGQDVSQINVRYSMSFYGQWDYDPASGSYVRWQDAAEAQTVADEQYTLLIDRVDGQPVQADNVVVILVPHEYWFKQGRTEIFDVKLSGFGKAYVFRDGRVYEVSWGRNASDQVLSLFNPDGSRFPLKPGRTFYQVLGANSQVTQPAQDVWRFLFWLP
ncbi:MAG: DUF3048 domain-containing protein [Anaerolineales bacterium]